MAGLSALLLSRSDVRAQVLPQFDAGERGLGNPAWSQADEDAATGSAVDSRILLAQGAAVALEASPLPPDGAQASVASLFEGFSLRTGPIRYGGSLSTDVRSSKAENQPGTVQMVDYYNIAAATYIWQPWLAQLRAGAGLVASRSRSQSDPAQANASVSASSRSMTGEFSASIFPLSRFPFELFTSRSDSRVSGDAVGSDFTTTRLGLRQTYMPADGLSRYTARFERNTLSSLAAGDDTVNLFEATANRRLGPHTIDFSGNHSTNTGGIGGASSRLDRINARHNWTPATNLQVDTLGSASRTLLRSGRTQVGGGDVDSRFVQLTSFGSWRPEEGEFLYDEDRPVYLTASGRFFSVATDTSAQTSDAYSMGGSLGATYNWSPHTRITGALNASQSKAGATSNLFTSQLATAVYTPPSIRLDSAAAVYNWSLSASAGNFTSTSDGGRQSLGGQASHNVQRSFDLGSGARLSLNANQALGIAADTASTVSTSISHGAGATWTTSADSGSQSYVSLTGADLRVLGGTGSSFQLVNLQASRQNTLTRLSYWAGHLTVQWTRQDAPTTLLSGGQLVQNRTGGTNLVATGSLSYFNQRVFGVPRLRFSATATAASQQFDSRLSGNPEARRENVSSLIEGRFDYSIGRLETRLSARSAVIDGRTDHLVFLRLSRRFGLF